MSAVQSLSNLQFNENDLESTMISFKSSAKEKRSRSFGSVILEGDLVTWDNHELGRVSFKLEDIVVIGEYTNLNGPAYDDWFLTFVTRDSKRISIPWYAENIKELTQELSDRFEPGLNYTLLSRSTSWNSVIRYPLELAGKKLFVLKPTTNIFGRFFERILSILSDGNYRRLKVDLSAEAANELLLANRK